MEADAQVTQLEQALIHQAESLAREQRERAESGKARILNEASEKIRLAEEREVMAAKAEAEKQVRHQAQAAETRLAAELDRLRWALTEATLSSVRMAFQELVDDDERYLAVLEQWLAAATLALPAGDLVAEVRPADKPRLVSGWEQIAARVAPGRKLELGVLEQISEGGIRVRLADNRARLDQTFEARESRLADELARVAMERLFASAPDLGTLVHG
ncbi:MAG: V-type ATP synthase subunit E [Hydrogenophilales bacterium CG_4_9_14_3_um_filter_63_34]|nr:MAG: V-type ATP synthase subunit E [Hydrogenophilales bacterium CG_4_10_14_3_um_filter_63_21]PJB04078.1 MAG: V-type ATP synthase subunit E [Hydrogenophilales bacterium CG_4_9_14_3_um_filter_63_34]